MMNAWFKTFAVIIMLFLGVACVIAVLSLEGCATTSAATSPSDWKAEAKTVLEDIRDAAIEGATCAPETIKLVEDAITLSGMAVLSDIYNEYLCVKPAVKALLADIKANKAAMPQLEHLYEVKLTQSIAIQTHP